MAPAVLPAAWSVLTIHNLHGKYRSQNCFLKICIHNYSLKMWIPILPCFKRANLMPLSIIHLLAVAELLNVRPISSSKLFLVSITYYMLVPSCYPFLCCCWMCYRQEEWPSHLYSYHLFNSALPDIPGNIHSWHESPQEESMQSQERTYVRLVLCRLNL
jgi:hypothetical protein